MTPLTAVHQASLSTGILQVRILEWLPGPPPGDLPNPGIAPRAPSLQADPLPTETAGMVGKWKFIAKERGGILVDGKLLREKKNQGSGGFWQKTNLTRFLLKTGQGVCLYRCLYRHLLGDGRGC